MSFAAVPSRSYLNFLLFLSSSGTSGKPKGVKLSHRNVLANILQNEVMVGESFGSQACHIDILPQVGSFLSRVMLYGRV